MPAMTHTPRKLSASVILLLVLSSACLSCSASLLGSSIDGQVDFSLELLGIPLLGQNADFEAVVWDGAEAMVSFPVGKAFTAVAEIALPLRTYKIDLSHDAILISAVDPGTFFGSHAFQFDITDWGIQEGRGISGVSLIRPFEASEFDLAFDADSITVTYVNDFFSQTFYPEIEIGISFVPVTMNSAGLLLSSLFLINRRRGHTLGPESRMH